MNKDRFLVNTFHFSAKVHFNTFFTYDCLGIVKYPHPLTINKKHFREFLKIVPYQHLTWGGRNGCLKDDDSRNGGNLEICDFCSICYCCCCSSLCRIAHWAIRKIDQVARALKLNLYDSVERPAVRTPATKWRLQDSRKLPLHSYQLTIFSPVLSGTLERKLGQLSQILVFFTNLGQISHKLVLKSSPTSPRTGAEPFSNRICLSGRLKTIK